MLHFNKILVPTDFTACADCGFEAALQFAEHFGAEVHHLHAVVGHKQSPAEIGVPFPMYEAEIAEQLHLARLAQTASGRGAGDPAIVQARVQDASAELAILAYADQNGIDLIVMGTHGRTGFDHWFSGSVAERVVRHATCPVMTIRQCEGPPRRTRIERILVPADLTERTQQALTYANDLAAAFGADLDVLHVLENGSVLSDASSAAGDVERARVEDALAAQIRQAGIGEGRATVHALRGHADTSIVEFAHKLRPDLVVISTHGRAGFGRLLLGSIAEKMVRLSPCPVLTIKAPETTTHLVEEPALAHGLC